MDIVQNIGQKSSQSMKNPGAEHAGSRVWRALVGSGMSRAAVHLNMMSRHYRTSQRELANELSEAAKWAQGQQF